MSTVHNHGPESGPGLACNERRRPDGYLVGACIDTARTFPDGSIEWADRPSIGECAPNVVPLPATVVDLWVTCFCADDTHPEREFAQRQTWGDGHPVFTPAWHLNRADAVTDYNHAAGSRHIVHRAAHIVVRPDTVEVA